MFPLRSANLEVGCATWPSRPSRGRSAAGYSALPYFLASAEPVYPTGGGDELGAGEGLLWPMVVVRSEKPTCGARPFVVRWVRSLSSGYGKGAGELEAPGGRGKTDVWADVLGGRSQSGERESLLLILNGSTVGESELEGR